MFSKRVPFRFSDTVSFTITSQTGYLLYQVFGAMFLHGLEIFPLQNPITSFNIIVKMWLPDD